MLQQTRVQAMIGPYASFLERFPDLNSLARSEEAEVVLAWRGLGYYSRARNLRKGAIQIVSEHGGAFPRTLPEALRIAGIGPYTAAAVLSLAFDLPVAAIDGNVRRVLSRLFDIPDAKGSVISDLADRMMQERAGSPGMHNEALMELGAVICIPGVPICADCPVRSGCASQRRGGATYASAIPAVKMGEAIPVRMSVYLIRDSEGRVLLRRDSASRFLKGHWFYPHTVELANNAMAPREVGEGLRKGAGEGSTWATGLRLSGPMSGSITKIPDAFVHTITKYRIRADLYLVEHAGVHSIEEGSLAVGPDAAGDYIVSSMQSKIERAIARWGGK
jgi:A/G-specific adenine glycosylase